jgi:hypothetical protein
MPGGLPLLLLLLVPFATGGSVTPRVAGESDRARKAVARARTCGSLCNTSGVE